MNRKLIDFMRSYMDEQGWSARQFAVELDVASATVLNILNGTTEDPKKDFLEKLARVTNTPYYKVRMMADPHLDSELESLINGLPDEYKTLPREILELAARLYRLPPDARKAIMTLAKADR